MNLNQGTFMARRGRFGVALLVLLSLAPALAADSISMSADDIARLGIDTRAPASVNGGGGAALQASVTLPPEQTQMLGFALPARVQTLLVSVGDQVKRGQALLTASSAELLETQKNFLQANAALKLARLQLQRDETLAAEGIIASRRLQESRNSLNAAQLDLNQYRSELQLTGFSADETASLAASGRLQPGISLRAPLDGEITEIRVTAGQRMEAGEPLLQLVNSATLWLNIQVPVQLADSLAVGQIVSVEQRDASGRIEQIGRVVDATSQSVTARASVTSGGAALRPGERLSVRAGASVGETPLLGLPRAAVVRNAEQFWVFVRSAEGFQASAVTLAGYAGDDALISSGLKASDSVAVRGIAALKGAWMGIGGGE